MIQISRSSLLILVYIGCLSIVQVTAAYTCKKAGEVGCASCAKLVLCDATLTPKEQACGSGMVCDKTPSGSASCYKLSATPAPLCKCVAPYPAYKADPFDLNKYQMCLSDSSQYTVSCPPGLVYDGTPKKCSTAPTVPPTPPPPSCSKPGFFGYGCNAYYGCFTDPGDETKLIATEILKCIDNTIFDASIPGCDTEENVIKIYDPFTCEATPVAQMDSVECNAFHICMGLANGEPTGEKICCNTGERFDSNSMKCVPASQVPDENCPQVNECIASKLPYNCSGGLASTSTTTISTISAVSSSSSSLSSTTSSFFSSISSSSSSSAISSSSSSSAISSSSSSSTIPSSTTTTTPLTPSCSSDGAFPYPGDCSKYYWCSGGKSLLQSCPSNMLFDKVKRYCDVASSVKC